MRKTSSSGNIFSRTSRPSSKICYVREGLALRPSSSNYSKKKSQNSSNNNLINFPNLFSSNSTSDISSSTINFTQPQKLKRDLLYEEVLQLKKQINNLKTQISLMKSDNQKKDGELLSKGKEIDNFLEDNKNSDNNNTQINVDKLKDANYISKLKKDYFDLKKILSEKENLNKDLKIQIKNAKPINYKYQNENLQKQLINILEQYNKLQEENNNNDKILQQLSNLPSIFQTNHLQIQNMQKSIFEKKQNIIKLKNKLSELHQIHNKNIEMIKKQNLNKFNLNKHNDRMLEDKKNKEDIIKMKSTYEKQIEELNNQLKEYKNKLSNNEKMLKDLSDSNKQIKKINSVDNTFLKQFNYNQLISIDKPNKNENQKILLLKSLVNESFNKRRNYIKIIEDYIEKLRSYGFDVSLIGGENGDISERNIVADQNSKSDDNLQENKNEDNKNNENEKENEKNDNNQQDNNNNQQVNNNNNPQINNDNNNDNNNNNENVNEGNSLSKQKTTFNEENNENNNNENNNNENNNNENNNNINEGNNLEEISTSKKDIELKNNLSNKQPISSLSILSNDDFTEFTYVLIKSLEAKKISEPKAKELIIDTLPENIKNPNETFERITNKISEIINCKEENSIEKIRKWLNTLYMMCNNDEQKTKENFLSLFLNIKIYSPEEELVLNKKVKKTLIPFKDIIKQNLISDTGFISFINLRKIMEDAKIEMKDDYAQYLFYQMKQFDNNETSIYNLKIQNLFDILENTEHDSKMNTESDIEISNDEYVQIITNFANQLSNYIKEKKTNLRIILKDVIQNVQAEGMNEKLDVVLIEDFIGKMKEIGIQINSDLEIYCLFSRYKISDEYEVISVDLLEKELENFQINRINQIGQNNIGEQVIEDVEEENEDNTLN